MIFWMVIGFQFLGFISVYNMCFVGLMQSDCIALSLSVIVCYVHMSVNVCMYIQDWLIHARPIYTCIICTCIYPPGSVGNHSLLPGR